MDGRETLLCIRGVASTSECQGWVAALEAGELAYPRSRFSRDFEAWSYGPCLDQSEDGLEAYFVGVGPFEDALTRRFADLSELVSSVLARLARPRGLRTLEDLRGRRCNRFTARQLPPGGLIPPHCENEQLLRPPYEGVRAQLAGDISSFFLVLQAAERGGALRVHELGAEALANGEFRHGHSDMAARVAASPSCEPELAAGDLVVFAAGRHFHQITPVQGTRARWTFGGFLAASSANPTEVWQWV